MYSSSNLFTKVIYDDPFNPVGSIEFTTPLNPNQLSLMLETGIVDRFAPDAGGVFADDLTIQRMNLVLKAYVGTIYKFGDSTSLFAETKMTATSLSWSIVGIDPLTNQTYTAFFNAVPNASLTFQQSCM